MPPQLPPKNGTLGYGMNGPVFEKLPDEFKCKVCQKLKPSSPFYYSKKELKTFTERAQKGKRLDAVTARLRCRECSGDPPDGIFCIRCEVIKPRDDFSQAARNRPAQAWCRACTIWQDSVDPVNNTLPIPSILAPKEGERGYAPETAEKKALRLSKASMQSRSVTTASVKDWVTNTNEPVVRDVAGWLSTVNTSQAAKSLLDEEDAGSAINYSSSIGAIEDFRGTPMSSGTTTSRNMLIRKLNAPMSILDMDDNAFELKPSTLALMPRTLFSNTILTPSRGSSDFATSAQVSISQHEDENWQVVGHKKKKISAKSVVPADGSSVVSGFKKDATAKSSINLSLTRSVSVHTRAKVTEEVDDSEFDCLKGNKEPCASKHTPDNVDLLAASPPLKTLSRMLEKSLLDDDIPTLPKRDYSRAFVGIDPFKKESNLKDVSANKAEEPTAKIRQDEGDSVSASEAIDNQLYESAIRRHGALLETPAGGKTKPSTVSADVSPSLFTDLNPQTPSLERELAAAGVALGSVAIRDDTTARRLIRHLSEIEQQGLGQLDSDWDHEYGGEDDDDYYEY